MTAKCGATRNQCCGLITRTILGPTAAQSDGSLRILERRRRNRAVSPPPLSTALRQLRLRVLDAQGPGVDAFITRVHGTATLAEMQNEPDVACELSGLGMTLDRNSLMR